MHGRNTSKGTAVSVSGGRRRLWLTLVLLLPMILIAGVAVALFTNGDFETGDFTGWTKTTFLNPGLTGPPGGPFTGANIVRDPGGDDQSVIVSSVPVETGVDPFLGPAATMRYPKYNVNSARVNGPTTGRVANTINQWTTVTASDIDPVDGKVHIRFAYAPVLQDPPHQAFERPFFFLSVRRFEGFSTTLLYSDMVFSGEPGVPWKPSPTTAGVLYTDWQVVDIVPAVPVALGDILIMEVLAAGCSQGGHFGYVYVDGFGSQLPGLSVVKSAHVPQVVEGEQLVYTFTYRNGGTTAVDSVVVRETIPPCATFVSATNPTTPGTSSYSNGVVTCFLGTLGPGAVGSFTVTVQADNDKDTCPEILNGNYTIDGAGVSPTLGPLVSTPIVDVCETGVTLVINSGWDQVQGFVQPNGAIDNEWVVVADPDPGTTEPRPAYVIPPYNPGVSWANPQPGSKWISSYPTAKDDLNGHYVFEYRFCLADNDDAAINLTLRADDRADVFLNGVPIGAAPQSSFSPSQAPATISYSGGPFGITWFVPGENVLRIDVENVHKVAMGLDVVGTITGQIPQYRYCCTPNSNGLLGTFWYDVDKDGVMDSNEGKQAGWTVQLMVGNTIVQTRTTDVLGNYYFLNLAPGTYKVRAVYKGGTIATTVSSYTHTLTLGSIIGGNNFGYRKQTITDLPDLPIYSYPNPFNPQTTIRFALHSRTMVNLNVYDVAGRLVRALANEELAAGEHERVWDGRNDTGQPVSSGVYFYKFVAGTRTETKKLVLLK